MKTNIQEAERFVLPSGQEIERIDRNVSCTMAMRVCVFVCI